MEHLYQNLGYESVWEYDNGFGFIHHQMRMHPTRILQINVFRFVDGRMGRERERFDFGANTKTSPCVWIR